MKVFAIFVAIVAFVGISQGFAPPLQNRATITTRRNAIDSSVADTAVPVALFLASVAASIVKSGDSSKVTPSPVPIPKVKVETATEAPKPVVELPPEPAPEPTPEPVAEPAPEPVAEPAPEPEPEPVTVEVPRVKDLSDLKVQVASTLEGEQEKLKRLEAKQRMEEKENAAAAAAAAAAEEIETAKENTVEEVTEAPKKKQSIFRLVWRIVKKIVAPWRKWKNIK